MKPKLNLCLALVLSGALCVAGCSSLTTSQVSCASLPHEKEELVRSDLNLLLVSRGFTATAHLSEYPSAVGWWFAPLKNGNADFTVTAVTNSYGMVICVEKSGLGRGGANKPLTQAIVACIQSNAPNAQVKVKVTTDYFSLWPKY
jgi:hypothetical protein